ncbi:hypothetical protein [Actinoplanes palleronii]|uniref:CheW-like domain-containing protein n=1 Tax=Actinoplanes palleronii TaxID=113570 RepID=A0ABQ4B5K8_9ACTN|nr:hypothetical protein [Actinoplanes palleronii]GIE65928.1 hypothetical protein Apa02nite_020360 [Actinoplanes palleronii]
MHSIRALLGGPAFWLVVGVVRSVPLPPLVPRLTMPDRQGQRREAGRGPLLRKPLPLPTVAELPRRDVVFGLSSMDRTGRIVDKPIMASLGWKPGLQVGFAIREGVIVIAPGAGQRLRAIDRLGHLNVPARVRQACRIDNPERVLLAAFPRRQLLLVHPAALVGHLTALLHAAMLGGGA